MREVLVRKAVRLGGILLATGLASLLLLPAPAGPGGTVIAQGLAQPWEMVLFGGSRDQLGVTVAVQGNQVIVGGEDSSAFSGVLRSFAIPNLTSLWALSQWGQWPASLATTDTWLFAAGGAYPPACGAYDGSGDTEGKVRLARYTLAGVPAGCWSYNFFPYRGGEGYAAAAVSNEGGQDYVYAAGTGEQYGWAYSGPFVLAKYDASGTMLNKATEPGYGWGWPPSWTRPNVSRIGALTILNGHVYAAGESTLAWLGEDRGSWDWGQRPMVMKYNVELNRVWKVRAGVAPQYPGYSGRFHGLAALGNHVYAVGGAIPSGGAGSFDYLIEKYDESGNRVWSASWGGPYEDVLRGVVAVGGRLFAVGYRYEPDGDADAVLFEISPDDGSILTSAVFGGDRVDRANGVATDGQDLYIVGETRSYASAEGNQIGQNEIMLIHYRLNRAPVADARPDQTVECSGAGCATVTLNAGGSSDPDGDPLTCTWTGGFGTADGVNPQVQLPIGQHTIALTVTDTSGATSSDTVVVTVVHEAGPNIGTVSVGPALLWPPDHRMVPVSLTVAATDTCDTAPVARIISVASNEAINGLGDGDTAPDWEITGDLALNLRAERSGTGSGRIYTITVQAADSAGNLSEPRTVNVLVPKSQKDK